MYKANEINTGYHPFGYRIDKTGSAINRYTRWTIKENGKWDDSKPVCFHSLPQDGWFKTEEDFSNREINPSIIFGPVPSRRLGRSLGINNIPFKTCSYACGYCQLGRAIKMQIQRQEFYKPEEIAAAVRKKVQESEKAGEKIDYLTFVPDGEPSLDINLGKEIELLKPLGIPIAVITNASLISNKEVRDDLMMADWVSVKIDTVEEDIWRKIDRPHKLLQLTSILDGTLEFSKSFKGKLITETMLLAGINDAGTVLQATAEHIGRLNPRVAYLSIPTRPPAEKWARQPSEDSINKAYQIFSKTLNHVEYLTGYEGNAFASTGDIEGDILSITAVHPMRNDAVDEFLKRAGANRDIVSRMKEKGLLSEIKYGGNTFYLRRFSNLDKSV
jgi:wyosine [tRNA(Phe)-imidazoG37] synthetase (radical SAM superfamily)